MSHVICPECASEVPVGSKFCKSCGRKLEAVAQNVQDPWQWDELIAPLVGRDAEVRNLEEHLGTARGGEPWGEVRGERGIGKTRLVQEAAKRTKGRRLLVVVAGSGTPYRPFGMARRLVHAVVCEVTGQVSPPQTREAFAAVLALLGSNLAPFVDAFWRLAVPNRLSAPVLDQQPQMLRWSLERGMATLLVRLAEHAPDLALFFDAYELADEASAALFASLSARPAGWPVPVVVASRDEGRVARRPKAVTQLGPLVDDAAEELLDQLVHGAELPEVLRRDVLAHAVGVPARIEELVRLLVDAGVLTPTEDGSGWSCDPRATLVSLPGSHYAVMRDRLEQPERDLLCQSAVQGIEFAPDVAQAVQRLVGWQGPPVRMLLPRLERRGLVKSGGDDRWAQWSFSSPLVQGACYEALPLPDRRALHGKTAEALCELTGGQEAVPPELLAYHYECAEQWVQAAEANLCASNRAEELFLNEEAVRCYQRVVAMIDRLEKPLEEATRRAALAHGGAARVHLRVGAYRSAEEDARKMRVLAVRPGDRAEADRLAALAHFHMGRIDEAERLLLSAVALARENDMADSALAHALCDLAELYYRMGRTSAARERLHECRAIAHSDDSLTLIRADLLESNIADAEGRITDVVTLRARAYKAAQHAGSLSELASASNGLGNAARDLGDYEAAQHHFEQALEIWELMGDAKWIANAYGNLGNLALSQGASDAAREHYERVLAAFRAIENIDGLAQVKANLAICAVEEANFPEAVAAAEASFAALSPSNALLRGQVLAVLGEGRLECGDALGAQREFDRVLQDCNEAHDSIEAAQARRGLGRVALMRGETAKALSLLEHALAGFERLKMAQEAARTMFYRACALRQLGENQHASDEAKRAQKQFVSMRMRADRDAKRVEQLLRELDAASRSQ